MKKKICFIVSTPYTAKAFLENHFEVLSKDYDVFLVANLDDPEIKNYSNGYLQEVKHMPIYRKISLLKDIKALFLLIRYLNKSNFDVTTTFTPKAGLIGILASKIVGVKKRVYFFTGQVWHTKKGVFKKFLMTLDKFVVALSTDIIVDGQPQRNFLIENKIIKPNRSIVLGKGTISGIDISRFSLKNEIREKIRSELNYSQEDFVFMFLGRLNTDKGIMDLVQAFKKINAKYPEAKLLVIGPDEENISAKIIAELDRGTYILYGSTDKPENLMQVGDVFCLPSHREAFGLSIIEASACGRPILCSDTYGLKDTIIENVTGLRHKAHDVDSIYKQMEVLIKDSALRQNLGINGRKYVEEHFSKNILTGLWLKYYNSLLKN